MIKPLALIILAASSVAMLIAFFVGSPALFAGAAVLYPPSLVALGAVKGRRLGAQAFPILGLALILGASMVGLFWFRGQDTWWGGLPVAATIQLAGLFLLPLLVTSWGYARTFDRWGLSEKDLDDLRRRYPRRGVDP